MRTKSDIITTYELRRLRFGHMPPLSHWPDRTLTFDNENSQVCQWLAAVEPGVPLPRLMRLATESRAIVFDRKTRLWKGCFHGLTVTEFETLMRKRLFQVPEKPEMGPDGPIPHDDNTN